MFRPGTRETNNIAVVPALGRSGVLKDKHWLCYEGVEVYIRGGPDLVWGCWRRGLRRSPGRARGTGVYKDKWEGIVSQAEDTAYAKALL